MPLSSWQLWASFSTTILSSKVPKHISCPFLSSQSPGLKIQTWDAHKHIQTTQPHHLHSAQTSPKHHDGWPPLLGPVAPIPLPGRFPRLWGSNPIPFNDIPITCLLPAPVSQLSKGTQVFAKGKTQEAADLKEQGGTPLPNCQHPPPPRGGGDSSLLSSVRKWGAELAQIILLFLPLPQC